MIFVHKSGGWHPPETDEADLSMRRSLLTKAEGRSGRKRKDAPDRKYANKGEIEYPALDLVTRDKETGI
ncbi:MAG: hypothetical protein IJQ95_05865 [Paludibacteraceae bacterium]|nr:hypothetical protein [Paludibacteraceae bacterium]